MTMQHTIRKRSYCAAASSHRLSGGNLRHIDCRCVAVTEAIVEHLNEFLAPYFEVLLKNLIGRVDRAVRVH